MKAALAVYATLFFAIYIYGLFHRLRELPQEVRVNGIRRPVLGLLAALSGCLMFVACFGWIIQHGIVSRYLWAAVSVATVASMLWTPYFVSQMQREHGKRVGFYGYILNTTLCIPMDVVLFVYAFRSPHLWDA